MRRLSDVEDNDLRVRLLLEGKDDVELIDQLWMPNYRERQYFLPTLDCGGCPNVLPELDRRRDDPDEIVLGLVDRDYLSREAYNHDLFFLVDDQRFREEVRQRFDRLHVHARWELENYLLLDADELAELWYAHPRQERPPRVPERDEVLGWLLAAAEVQLPLQAARLLRRGRGDPDPRPRDHHRMASAEAMTLALHELYPDLAPPRVQEMVARLRAFAGPLEEDRLRRWTLSSRVVDGKWVIQRICAERLALKQENLPRDLALRARRSSAGPPAEIRDTLAGLLAHAREIKRARRAGEVHA